MADINLIKIQDDYVATVEAAYSRWSHRRGEFWEIDRIGGHYSRIVGAARQKAIQTLVNKAGFTLEQAKAAVTQAHDVALLERNAEEEVTRG